MQRDKEAVAALMREKQKKGTFSFPTRPAPPPPRHLDFSKSLRMLTALSTHLAEEKKAAEAKK